MRKLTEKQAKFVIEYQKDQNATQAAIRAGYSVKNADKLGPRLVGKGRVFEEIEKDKRVRLQKIGVDVERILTRMAQLAYADIRRLYRPDGTLLPPHEWPDDVAPAVGGVEVFEEYQGTGKDRTLIGHTKKVRMWDPNTPLINLGKNQGIFPSEKKAEGEGVSQEFNITNLELSAKLVLWVTLMVRKQKEIEEAKSQPLLNKS